MAKKYNQGLGIECKTVTLVNSDPPSEEMMEKELDQLKENSEVLLLRDVDQKREFYRMVA
jgi:hypothetical protein